jgi:hypothetical protein
MRRHPTAARVANPVVVPDVTADPGGGRVVLRSERSQVQILPGALRNRLRIGNFRGVQHSSELATDRRVRPRLPISAKWRCGVICPHCGIGTSPNFDNRNIGDAEGRSFSISSGNCTECRGFILTGRWWSAEPGGSTRLPQLVQDDEVLLYPAQPLARRIPPEVTGDYAQDYHEACLVREYSPKASAALSRRLLQHILREKAGITKPNLDQEINEAIAQGHLPPDLAEDLDMIRTVGNFAAHPIKSTNTGEVVDVEPGEAEGLLDLVEELLGHYFVRPARRAEKRQHLNTKLAEAGKPALKGSPPPPAAPPTL